MVRIAHLLRIRTFGLLMLTALLLLRVGPFCEAAAMAAQTGPTAMVGCADTPAAPAEKGASAKCTMTACAALADAPVELAVAVIHTGLLPSLPSLAGRDGLDPAPATPPPRPV